MPKIKTHRGAAKRFGLTKNGKVIAQSTRGMANTAEGKEVTIDTLFPIGSNSKQFCAVAIFMLNEQGKLSLDDTLSKYFPEYTAGADVTIRQMLTMRSGIRDFQEGAFREFEPTVGGTQEENQQKILDWLNSHTTINHITSSFCYATIIVNTI